MLLQEARSSHLPQCSLVLHLHTITIPYPTQKSMSTTLVHQHTCHHPEAALSHFSLSHPGQSRLWTTHYSLPMQSVSCVSQSQMGRLLEMSHSNRPFSAQIWHSCSSC